MTDLLAEPTPARDELRAISADPASSKKQVTEAKLVLCRRIANGTERVRQVCEHFDLTPEQTEKMVSSHQHTMSKAEAKAAEEVKQLERVLEGAWE